MKRKGQEARLTARQKSWDGLSTEEKAKTRRPGSYKKPYPLSKKRGGV